MVGRWMVSRLRLGLVVVGLFALMGAEGVQATTVVSDIAFAARSDGEGYVVRVHVADTVKAYGMPQFVANDKVKWVLYNTSLSSNYQKSAPKGPVERYTVTSQNGHLVLHFHLDSERSIEAEAYRDGVSTDLLLNLSYGGDGPVSDAQSSETTVQTASQDGSADARQGRSGASKDARERWKLDTIVIDPGHGGKDPGATGNGLQEKEVVLDVAHKLGKYIQNRLGVDVVYTRRGDRFIPLKKRGKMANKAGAKLFISLHANAARASAAKGTETYFLGQHKNEAARKVMKRENSVIKYEEDTEKYDEFDEEALVRQTLTQSAYMRQSEKLASLVQTQFEERVNRRSRGVHQAGFYVLWSASMPSVLVELGFITNPTEARFLNSKQGQTYLASAIFRAVRAYKTQYEKGIFASE